MTVIGIADKPGDRCRRTDASGRVLGEFSSLDEAKEALEG